MVDEVPRVLAGRYEVGDLIGRGGMAEVHIGHDIRLGRTIAVKILRSDLARDPSFQNRFRREAQSAASLNHPAIVSVYDTGEDVVRAADGTETPVPFIVMEYVEGHTVRDLLQDGSALPIEEAIEITAGVLTALEYSHQASIVHRDIKPGNVMLTPSGDVKVMDFGIARAMADASSTMTQTHAVIGTAQYLSPEQARGEVVDTRSDLYSTGCLLYELLTGRPPFEGDSAVSVAYQHVSEQPQPPSIVAPDVPETLDRIVIKALAKDREVRYNSAAEFRADLEAAARDGVVTAPALAAAGAAPTAATQVFGDSEPPTTPAPLPPPQEAEAAEEEAAAEEQQRSNKALVWILVIVGLLAAAGIGYLIWDRANQPEPVEVAVVPDLEGLDEAGVTRALAEEDLQPDFSSAPHDEIPEGIAISWEPGTGEEIEKVEGWDNVVEVVMSTGPDAAEIPDVSGLTQDRARETLREAGFENVRTESRNDPGVGADVAIGTEPSAGQSVGLDTEITLILGTGNVELQDMTGETLEAFEAHMDDLDLSYRVFDQEDTGPPGIVLSQNPSGIVPQNTQVTVYVSVEVATPVPGDDEDEDEDEGEDGSEDGDEGGEDGGSEDGNEDGGNEDGGNEDGGDGAGGEG